MTTTKELQKRRITIIGVISGELLHRLGIDESLDKPLMTHWHVPATHQAVLSLRFAHGKERAPELSEELERQRKEGRWPKSEDAFYDELLPFLESPDELGEQIKYKDRDEPVDEALQPMSIFPEKRSIEQWVMLLAIFLRRLSPANLSWLLERLLESESVEVESKKEVPAIFGGVHEMSESVSRPLLDVFWENPDQILRSCRLEAVPVEDGERVIVFSTPGLREKLHRFVRRHHPLLVQSLFEKLRVGGLIFDPSAPQGLVAALIRLTVARALEDSSYYGEHWLRGSMLGMKTFLKIETSPADSEMAIMAKLIQVLRHQAFWNHFCHRLSELIREMLRHQSLEGTVRRFLQGLLREREHEAALEIVLFISRDLRSFRRFDLLYWLRQLIEQGPEELEEETYKMLLRITSQSHVRILEFLDGIQSWLPEPTLEQSRYSFSHRRALHFIMDFCITTAERVPERHFGRWPTPYPLFRALQSDSEQIEEQVVRIVTWMHHPALIGSVDLDRRLGNCSHHHSIAALLERWAWIIEGIQPSSEAAPEAVELLNLWIAVLRRHSGRGGRQAMRDYWHWKQELYLRAIGQVPLDQKIVRDRLKSMRQKAIELRQRFMSLEKEHS